MIQPFLATVPDASIPTAIGAAFAACALVIRTLYTDSKAESARARAEREAMLAAMERLTDAVTKLCETRTERAS